MYKISNGMLDQAEIVLKDRWTYGPLELVFVKFPVGRYGALDSDERAREQLAFVDWNRHHHGGFVRDGEACEVFERLAPGVFKRGSPNVILVPESAGATELHHMLASLLPDRTLSALGVERKGADLWLNPWSKQEISASSALAIEDEFSRMVWARLAGRARLRRDAFSEESSLRLLAGDARLSMNRLYRVAMEREEEMGGHDSDRDPEWRSLSELQGEFFAKYPDLRETVTIRRPLYGGAIWDPNDPEDRDWVLEEAVHGLGEMPSIQPVVETLLSHPTHDDFSDRVSWIKEDFERAFYSKRARARVDLIETIDEFPAWDGDVPIGYDDVLFRDILAYFDQRDRRLLIAVRNGRTMGAIAESEGYADHAPVSRRLKEVRRRLARLLDMETPPEA